MILYVVQLVNGQKQSTVREGQWSQCKEMKKKTWLSSLVDHSQSHCII